MSQYPYQYSNQPGIGYVPADPYASLLGPAKRAAVATFIVGSLSLLGAICFGGVGLAAPESMLGPMVEQSGDPNITPAIIRIVLIVIAVGVLLFSVALLVLGLFIWRASTAALITAIVLTSLALLLVLANSAISLPQARGMDGAELAGFGCVTVVAPLLTVGYLVMLVLGVKSARQYREAQAAYQAQYWQYQQQQQAYGQAGYGYAAPPAPRPDQGGTPTQDPPAP
jgi:hypothetical protein